LIERVVLHPGQDGLQVELVGEIVKMVELSLDTKKAALPKPNFRLGNELSD
jgi:hypothetical protein